MGHNTVSDDDDEWALEDEEEPVHKNEPPSDINNHYDGGNDHRYKRAKC